MQTENTLIKILRLIVVKQSLKSAKQITSKIMLNNLTKIHICLTSIRKEMLPIRK